MKVKVLTQGNNGNSRLTGIHRLLTDALPTPLLSFRT